MKKFFILLYSIIILFSNNAFADEKAEKVLKDIAEKTRKTQALSGDYEIIRRHLDPYEEIRERGQFRFLRPNFLSINGENVLPDKTSGKWVRVSDATGYISNGDIFYSLFKDRTGLSFKDAKADSQNILISLYPVGDFFDESKSFVKQTADARANKILTSLSFAGEKEWEGSPYKVLEFTTAETIKAVPKKVVTQLYIGTDGLVYRSIVSEKFGDLSAETETILRNVFSNKTLKPTDFSYRLPAGAKAVVPPPDLLAKGVEAPDVTLIDNTGKIIKLSDFRGKTVVLDFWATWCVPCLKTFPHTSQTVKSFTGKEVVVLAVNIWDSRENAATWISKKPEFGLFVFASDVVDAGQKSSTNLFNVSTLPLQYVISPTGKIVAAFKGYLGPSHELEEAIKTAESF